MVDGKPKVWMRKQTEEVQREPVMHRVAESIRQATENQKHKRAISTQTTVGMA